MPHNFIIKFNLLENLIIFRLLLFNYSYVYKYFFNYFLREWTSYISAGVSPHYTSELQEWYTKRNNVLKWRL